MVFVSLLLIRRPSRSWRSVSGDMAAKLTVAARLPARLPVRFDRGTQVIDATARYAGSRSLLTPVKPGSWKRPAAALQRVLEGEWRDCHLQGWSRLISA